MSVSGILPTQNPGTLLIFQMPRNWKTRAGVSDFSELLTSPLITGFLALEISRKFRNVYGVGAKIATFTKLVPKFTFNIYTRFKHDISICFT